MATTSAVRSPIDELRRSASADASSAAARAGVTVDIAHGREELAEVSHMLDEVWAQRTGSVLPTGALIALAHSGNYVATARAQDGALIGTAVGFFAPPSDHALHSHIAGVRAGHRGHGVGHALKLHQRSWALQNDVTSITWTFDPLVARNAYLNLHVLGARLERYLVDLYGPMADGLNRGDESDRALVCWDLTRSPDGGVVSSPEIELLRGVDDHPVFEPQRLDQARPEAIALRIPSDIEALRAADPSAAKQWRESLRTALNWADAEGWQVVDASRDGAYILRQSR